jgi:hypothetical protein
MSPEETRSYEYRFFSDLTGGALFKEIALFTEERIIG